MRAFTGIAAALAAATLAGPALADDVALRVGAVQQPGAQPLEEATVVIRDGKVAEVSHVADDANLPTRTSPGAWVVPGFCDPLSRLGALNDTDEPTRPLGGELHWLLDPRHPDFALARAQGITACLLAPGDATVFGGEGVVLHTDGSRWAGARRVAKLTLAPSAWQDHDLEPTSRAGALALLRRRLREAHDQDAPTAFGTFARGDVPAIVRVAADDDIRALIALAKPYGLELTFALDARFGAGDLDDVDLAGHRVILGPYDLETPARSLRLAAELAAREVPLAFTGGAPDRHPASQRLTAALAVRHGLSQAVALDGLTRVPAEILGLAGLTGGLQPGERADLVVLSGSPLRVSSRVLAVYLGGEVVHTVRPLPWKEDQ